MKYWIAITVVLIASSHALAAPIPKELRYDDRQIILGAWVMTEANFDDRPYAGAVGTVWTFDSEKAHRQRPDGTSGTANWKIDSQSNPKAFDWNTVEGSSFPGVYEMTHDRLTVVLALPGSDRPTVCKTGENRYHFVFTRRK